MRATFLRVAVLGLPVMLAVSCGGNPTSRVTPLSSYVVSIKPAFSYVLNGLSTNTVSMFTVNSCTGDLIPDTGHYHNRNQPRKHGRRSARQIRLCGESCVQYG